MTASPSGRVRTAFARHLKLATSMAVIVAGFIAYGVATASPLALPYGVIIVGGALLAAAVEPEEGFSQLVLAGLALWASSSSPPLCCPRRTSVATGTPAGT